MQVKTHDANGEVAGVQNLTDVALAGTSKTLEIEAARGTSVETDVLIQTEEPKRTWVVRSEAKALLRPDLVVAAISAPAQTLTTRPIGVRAEIVSTGDVDAEATVTLSWGADGKAAQRVVVPARGTREVAFADVALTVPQPTTLTVAISEVAPIETDATNNARTTSVDVTEHELARSRLILDNLGGFGAQFNHHVFAKLTVAPPGTIGGLEPKVRDLEPQVVRIFYNDDHENPTKFPDRYASFIDVVRMAHELGATINITYQTTVRAQPQPDLFMEQFAAVLCDLVNTRGYTNVRWVTVQNEPNRVKNRFDSLTFEEYEELNRDLWRELGECGLAGHIRIMAGDLVENDVNGNHRDWMAYITTHMLDIVAAYSEHIYWNYWDIPRMEFRLRDVRKLMFEELPVEARRPVYLIEYGVRGQQTNFPGKPNLPGGYYADGSEIIRNNIAGFQQLWFNVVAAQLGFEGTAKWDAYWGTYDNTKQAYYTIGPASEGWPLFPSYHALRMLFQTTQRGWHVLGVDPWVDDDWAVDKAEQPEKEITAFAGPSTELTLIGLDTHGRDLNAASTETPSYSVAGLPPSTTFNLAVWNATGNGENVLGGTVTTSSNGVARFAVPLHGAFALTTVPMS